MSNDSARDVFEESFTATLEEETISQRDLESLLSQSTGANAFSQSQNSSQGQEYKATVQPPFLNLIGSGGSSQPQSASQMEVEDEENEAEESRTEVADEETNFPKFPTPEDDMPVDFDAANQYYTENIERLIADAPPVHGRLQLGGRHQELLRTPPNHRVSVASTSNATPLKKDEMPRPKRRRGRPRTRVVDPDPDRKPVRYQPFAFFQSINSEIIKRKYPKLEDRKDGARELYYKMLDVYEEKFVFDALLKETNERNEREWHLRHPGMKYNWKTRRAEPIDEEETEDEGDI